MPEAASIALWSYPCMAVSVSAQNQEGRVSVVQALELSEYETNRA
jgi:hypothetical protein